MGARVTDEHEWPVGAVVCVHDRKMDEPWCLVSLLGAAGERIGYDRWLKAEHGEAAHAFVVSARVDAVPPSLMATFGSMLIEQRAFREVFGVI